MKRALLALVVGALVLPMASTQAVAQAPAPLSFFTNYFVTGDYEVAGTSLWRKGVGGRATASIAVDGEPEGADIVAAFLYVQTAEVVQWSGIDHATFKGNDFGPGNASLAKALNWEQATRPCWSVALPGGRRLVTYRADVLRFFEVDDNSGKLAINGSHTVSVPDYGYTFGDDDELGIEAVGNTGARAVGASLLIVYRDPDMPFRGVVIYDGGFTKRAFATMLQPLAGYYQASGDPAARLTAIVGDGRPYLSERVRVNGQTVATNPFTSSDGAKWDNPTFNLSSAVVPANSSSATVEIAPNGLLSDCVSASALVMSVNVQDGDGDGLVDVWEQAANLTDPLGQPLPNLGAMGATVGVKDLFIEVGAMVAGANTAYGPDTKPAHTHLPGLDALQLVGDAFLAAPTGAIRVHFDVGPGYPQGTSQQEQYIIRGAGLARGGDLIDEQTTVCPPGANVWECQFSQYPGTVGWKTGYRFLRDQVTHVNGAAAPPTFDETLCGTPGYVCTRRFDPNRQQSFHYALFAHAIGLPKSEDPASADFHVPRTNAGIADFPGGDVMVTLGAFADVDGRPVGTPFMQASTLMHELGHNLELRHGGGALEPNCKPTYFSVMNYLYQLRGLLDDGGAPNLGFSSNGPAIAPVFEGLLPAVGIQPYRLGWFAPLTTSYLNGKAKIPTRFCNGADIPAGFPAAALSVRVDAAKTTDAIDWRADGDGDPQAPPTVAQDVNFDGDANDTLASFDDWAHVALNQIGSRRNVGVIFPVTTPGGVLDAVGPLSVNLGKGDLGKGDLGKGDLGKGDLGKGDLGKGDLGKGDLGKGDLGKGDLGGGDLFDPVGFPAAPPGGELDFETFTSMGNDPAYEFRACVVGSDCVGAPPELQVHDVLLTWTPATGGVVSYTAFRAPGAAIPDESLWTAVGPPVPAGANPLQQIDTASLVNGATYTYFVLATYSDGTTSAPSNPVTVVAVNDPFVAGNDNYATAEDTLLSVPANGVLANDNDPDDAPPYTVELVSGPASGTLSLFTDGGFTYTPAANAHGTVSFTYKAKAGALESNVATVTIVVTPVNDPPTISNIADRTINANASTGAVAFTIGDIDDPTATTLAVAGSSNNPTLVPAAGIVFGGSGTARTVTVTPAANQSGSATVTVTVTDTGGLTATDTFVLTVNAVGYGFVNVKNLPPPSGTTFKPSKYGTLVDFKWQFTKNGAVVASSDAQPSVTITGPGGYNQTFTPANCGAFGFRFTYNSSYKKWEFDWKPKNAAVGTYSVVVRSGKTGQNFPSTGGFPVVFRSY
jgi:hypothetical protein